MKNITASMETLSIFESIKKHRIHPKRYMGQNFLISENVLGEIIKSAELSKNDTVLEIGPGLGSLTIELAKRVQKVIAVEKDRKMCEILQKILSAKNIQNIQIINNDILNTKYQIPAYRQGRPDTKYKLVANLPYYITSPVIRKFLEADHKPELMILMIQKEVAQRICAKPPKMSLLSVAVQFYAKPEIIDYVPKNCFYPQPKVDSAILRIEPRINANLSANECKYFFELVKRGFSAKRKMLKNNLSILLEAGQLNFEKIGLNPKVRAENLSINDWLKLFHGLNIP